MSTAMPSPAARAETLENRRLLALTLPALVLAAILMLAPMGWLVGLSFTGAQGEASLEHYARITAGGAYVGIFIQTFQIAFLVTLCCVLLAYPVAYLLTILPPRWAQLGLLLVLVPFWTSLLVRTYAWLVLLQRRGVVNEWLMGLGLTSKPLALVYNMTGTVIGMVHVMVPFLVLPLYAAMRGIDGDLIRAAAGLGATPSRAFRDVFLPLSLPGLIAGTLMVFVMSLGFYVTPALLGGGKVTMISQRIEQSVSLYPTWGPAAALAVVLFVLTAAFLGAAWLILRHMRATP